MSKSTKPLRHIDDIDDSEYQEERIKSIQTQNGYWVIDLESGGTYAGCKADPRVKPRRHSRVRLYGKGFGYVIRGCAINGKVVFYRTAKQQAALSKRALAKSEREQAKAKEQFKGSKTMEKPRAKFTVRPEKLAAYEAWRAKNDDPYGGTCFLFAERWAELMEQEIVKTNDPSTVKMVAERCSREADKDFGITGFMYGMAVSILSEAWIYGETLRKWHNGEYGHPGARGVVNPAVLVIGDRKESPTS